MKIRHYGALTSAFLITLSTGAAQASDCAACNCPPAKAVHRTAARPAPARVVRRNADAEAYAKSFYDYHSASAVSEVLVRRVAMQPADWQVAPNDARIRFQPADVGMVYGPPRQAIAINDNDFTGGVGNTEGGYNNGGGYGGQVILANPNGENGPNYNSYGESFQNNPSAASNYGQFVAPPAPHGYFPGTPPTR